MITLQETGRGIRFALPNLKFGSQKRGNMNQLCYETLAEIGYTGFLQKDAPVRALQFGEGNFLRAFADYFFDVANEKGSWNGKIAMIQPTPFGRTAPVLNAQDDLYTLYLRGRENGAVVDERRVISVSDKCYNPYLKEEWDSLKELAASDELEYVISNTTEAGIVFDPEAQAGEEAPASFPAKLTLLLLERFHAGKKGLVILPCELIDDNGKILRDCVLSHIEAWKLGDDPAGSFRYHRSAHRAGSQDLSSPHENVQARGA